MSSVANDGELAAVAAVIGLLLEEADWPHTMRIHEIWPEPSPWRWAPVSE